MEAHGMTVMALVGVMLLVGLFWMGVSMMRLQQEMRADDRVPQLQQQLQGAQQLSNQQMEAMRSQVQTMQNQVQQVVLQSQRIVGDRLDHTTKTITEVQHHLGRLGQSSEQILEMGRDVHELQQVLRSPKLRGNLGELFLNDLLRQILPQGHYATQHRFGDGEVVDAVIRLKGGLVPVDAKFPLENFKRVIDADGDEASREEGGRKFARDVARHVDAIARKYIRPEEGTLDFALMYIPAENIYYEIIVKDDQQVKGLRLLDYALKHRVIPTSPNSFYAYLQTVLLGLRGLQIEENARAFMDRLAQIRRELDRFGEDYEVVGRHLDNATKKFREADRRLGKVGDRLAGLDEIQVPAKPKPVGEEAIQPAIIPKAQTGELFDEFEEEAG